MRFLIVPLLGWGMMAFGGDVTPTHSPSDSGLFGDVDTRCDSALALAAKVAFAKQALARVLVVDEIPMNRELYTTIFHSGAVPKFFRAIQNLPEASDAAIRSHIAQRTFDSFAESSFIEPEAGKPESVFVYTVANFQEAAVALAWAKRNGFFFDLAVTAGLFPENAKEGLSVAPTPALRSRPFECLFNPRSSRGLSERQRPSGTPVFDLIDDIRRSDPRTRIVVCSNWEEQTVQEYCGRPRLGRREYASPNEWYVLAVVPHLLVFELWKSIRPQPQPSNSP
jgi:hypothetical protein